MDRVLLVRVEEVGESLRWANLNWKLNPRLAREWVVGNWISSPSLSADAGGGGGGGGGRLEV